MTENLYVGRSTNMSELVNALMVPRIGRFDFRICDADGEVLELQEPTEYRYRVYDESGHLVEERLVTGCDRIPVNADPSERYALWLNGEYVTFHDELPE